MEKVKSFFLGGKAKVYALVLLQGTIGLFVGNYFLRPAVVTTAVVSTTIGTSSLMSESANCNNHCYDSYPDPDCAAKKKHLSLNSACVLACAEIAKVKTPVAGTATATGTGTGTGTGTSTGTATGTGTGTGTAATACTTCKMFVTTSTYTGATIGGITGADAKCASDAAKPATGTYKAFLVDDTNRIACTTANCSGGASENKNWVLKANTAYTRVDGTAIATSTASALLPATLTNPISTTGDTMLGNIRTGMAFAKDWTSRVNGHCTNYTVTTGSSTDGDAGTVLTTSSYLYVNGGTCAGLKSLLCVEQ